MSSQDASQAHGLLTLAQVLAKLKRVPRTGWLDRGVPAPDAESVADHSLAVALLAWACAVEQRRQGSPIDPARVALLALIHDLPEAETGDVPPYDSAELPAAADAADRRDFLDRRHLRDELRRAEKDRAEDAAMHYVSGALPESAAAELRSLWEELRRGQSEEARFVKQVDRLETFLQSLAYLERFPDAPMASFHREVLETIDDPLLARLRDGALTRTPGQPPAPS